MPVGRIRADSQSLRDQRSLFPGLANKAYFNYGGMGVIPRAALEEIRTAYEMVQRDGPFSMRVLTWVSEELERTRHALSSELGGQPDCFAITHNATEGCNIVFWGIDWEPGDQLIITDSEHFGVQAAARQVAKRHGLNLTVVPTMTGTTSEIVQSFASAIGPKTKLVAISHVLWNTGRTLPIAEIQSLCRQANVQLLVDGAQSAGVIPLDLGALDIDYFAFPGHKWLCGPEGVGALYVSPQLIEELQPTFVGWRGAFQDTHDKWRSRGDRGDGTDLVKWRSRGDRGDGTDLVNWRSRGVMGGEERLRTPGLRTPGAGADLRGVDGTNLVKKSAARFEVATSPFPLLCGLRAAIAVHQKWGTKEERFEQLVNNVKALRKGLSNLSGVDLIIEGQETPSGLVSFAVKDQSHSRLLKMLEEERVLVRNITSPDCLRASVHYLTDESEIKQLLGSLSSLLLKKSE